MNENACAEFYFAFHDIPGWLNICELSEEVRDYLCQLDGSYQGVWKRVASVKKELELEVETGLLEFGDSDADAKINHLSKLIADFETDYAGAISRGLPSIDRLVMVKAARYDALRKIRRQLQSQQIFAHNGSDNTRRLPEEQIVRARDVPLESILTAELDAHNKILCPFHEDEHPSMLVKNGFAHCFVCGKSCDAIGWLMKIEGMSFPDAVRRLAP